MKKLLLPICLMLAVGLTISPNYATPGDDDGPNPCGDNCGGDPSGGDGAWSGYAFICYPCGVSQGATCKGWEFLCIAGGTNTCVDSGCIYTPS